MSPSPSTSTRLLSLLALGSLTASNASPALQGRQFGTGTTGGGGGCAAIATSSNTTYSPSAVRACLESTPFSDSVRTNTLEYIRGMLTLDVFEENHKQTTGSILDQGVDVRARLTEMESKVYTSDYAFQREVSDLMWSLNDGHYYWTNCYDFFATAHGVPLVALSTDPTARASIYVAPDIQGLAREYVRIDPSFYSGIDLDRVAGARVVRVDGQDVWDYLDGAADRAGVYQDKQQRLNSLFASPLVQYGGWDHDPGRFAVQRGFDNDSLRLTLVANGTQGEYDIDVPWRTYWTSEYRFSYDSGESFFSARCSSGSSDLPTSNPSNSTVPLNGTELDTSDLLSKLPRGIRSAEFGRRSGDSPKDERLGHIAKIAPRQLPELRSFISANSSSAQRTLYRECPARTSLSVWPFGSSSDPTRDSSYLGGRDVQFYALDQQRTGGIKTGVIFVTTFDPQPATATCFNRFILDIVIGLQNFTQAGVQRILVDTSNNGGGYVYLSGVLQLALAGGQYEPDLNFEVLFRKSNLSEAAVQAYVDRPTTVQGYWNPVQFLDADARPLSASDNWMNPGVDFPIGSAVLSASNRVQFASENSYAQIEGVNPTAPFTSEEIVFTGNGLCGSACGGFTSFLAEYYNTTGFISTAQPGEPITYTAFTSGNAVSSYYVDQELSDLRVSSTTYRPDLETTAELGFSMSGSLSPRIAPGQFIQYRPLVANGTFALTLDDYLSPVKRWEGVASRYFGADVGAGGGGGGAGGARDTTGGGSNGARSGVIRSGGGVAMMTVFAVVCVGWVW